VLEQMILCGNATVLAHVHELGVLGDALAFIDDQIEYVYYFFLYLLEQILAVLVVDFLDFE